MKNSYNPRLVLFATLALVSAASLAEAPVSPEAPAKAAAIALSSNDANFRYPAELPPEAAARAALAQLPELQAARAGMDFSAAERQRLQSGPYEWSLRGETSQRRTRIDGNFHEYEISIDRPVRWFGKAEKDEELGQQTMTLAGADYAHAWYEAGRALINAWFELLREERAALLVAEQAALGERLLEAMQKRVRAGESPKMELLLAQTEYQRLIAVQQQAAQRAALARIALEQKYPGLPLPPDASHALLPEILGEAVEHADWVARIVAGSHELGQAQAHTRQKQLLAERSALERKPDPTIGVRYTSERSGEERIVGLAVSIPLPGEARSAAYAGALAQLDQARQEEMRVRNKIEREARQLLAQAQAAKKIAATQAHIREQVQSNAALVAKAYMLGESAFADTLLASRQSLEATQSAETARLDALEFHARLLFDARLIWALEAE
ncbi:MAG: TolC family protein [Betaproteobacteria bacterium]|nr:TolC family protein [Betaproteobacteria bacterium]